jgi:stage V sporulation protein S
METLKVSAHSKTKALAGALAAVIRTEGIVELQAIGAGAVNQAIKAVAIARGYVAPNGINLIIIPSFVEIMIDGEERTAIKITVEPR